VAVLKKQRLKKAVKIDEIITNVSNFGENQKKCKKLEL
jgi:hypothetical protein